MALSLGSINFGLGADTSGLTKSLNTIINFGAEVERAANRTSEGSDKAAAALRRQEAAALSALQQTLNFTASVRRIGGSSNLIDQQTTAMNRLTGAMTKGNLSTLGFQRSQEAFQATLQKGRRRLVDFSRGMGASSDRSERFMVALRDLSSAATLAVGPLSGIGARITALTNIFSRANLVIAGFVGGFVAIVGAFALLSTNAIKVGLELDTVTRRLELLQGGAAGAATTLDILRETADQAGVKFLDMADNFSRFAAAAQGTTLTGQEVISIFQDMTVGLGTFRLGTDQTRAVFLALEQMLSKGVVSAEELRKQLGNALPGAFQVAAKAMELTTEELDDLLRKGGIASDMFLRVFAPAIKESFGAGEGAVEGMRASLNRLANAQTAIAQAFDSATGSTTIFEGSVNTLADTLEGLAFILERSGAAATAFGTGLAIAFAPQLIAGMGAVVVLLGRIPRTLTGITAALRTLGITLAAFSGGWLILIRLIAAAAAAFGVFKLLNDDAAKSFNSVTDSARSYLETIHEVGTANATIAKEHQEQLAEQVLSIMAAIKIQEDQLVVLNDLLEKTKEWFISDPSFILLSLANITKELEENKKAFEEALELEGIAAQARRDAVTAALDREVALRAVTIDAIEKADLQIARAFKLANAMDGVTGSVANLERQFKNADAIKKMADDLERAGALEDVVADRTKRLSAALATLNTAKLAAANLDLARVAAENFAIAAAEMSGEGLGSFFKKEFAISRQVDAARAKLIALDETVENATAAARLFGESLDALAESEKAAFIDDADKMIENMHRMADAILEGEGAVDALDRTLDSEDQIREFEAKLRDLNIVGAEFTRRVKEMQAAIDDLDFADAVVELEELELEFQRLDERIATTAFGSDALKRMEERWDIADTVEHTRQVILAATGSLEQAAAGAQLMEDRLVALQQMENQLGVFDAMREGADSVADALGKMAASGQFNATKLIKVFQNMVAEIIAEMIKLRIMRPLMDSLLGSSPNIIPGGGGGSGIFDTLSGLISAGLGAFGGFGGSGTSALTAPNNLALAGSTFNPTFAAHGLDSVVPNSPIIVGESGPEVFAPGINGAIISNRDLAASLRNNQGNTIQLNMPIILHKGMSAREFRTASGNVASEVMKRFSTVAQRYG